MEKARAKIERGEIIAAERGGYTVRSLDRPGIETPPIKALGNATYTALDRVYFFLFDDGHGMILAAI